MTKKGSKKKLQTSDKIMFFTFIILALLVIILTIVAVSKKVQKDKVKEKDLVIPILDKKAMEQVQIDISGMKKGEKKKYIFQITNYKNKEVNKNKITYHISFSASDDVSLKLQEENKDQNLLKENKMTHTFSGKEKQDIVYELKITANKTIPKNSFVSLEITS